MDIEEILVNDIATDLSKGDVSKLNMILLIIIQQLIAMAIKWFFDRYTDERKSQEAFHEYFKNMNFIRRLQWHIQTRRIMRRYKGLVFTESEISESISKRLGDMNLEQVGMLFSKF